MGLTSWQLAQYSTLIESRPGCAEPSVCVNVCAGGVVMLVGG